MGEASTIYLVEGATGLEVEAELRDTIEQAQLDDWEQQWQPAVLDVLRELIKRGVPQRNWPQSYHWDWARKTAEVQGLLAFRGFSVVAQRVTQGLARVDLNKSAREPSEAGKPLVYLDYVEVAPWNRPELGATPRLRGVGTALVSAAVALSMEEGFRGRIGLHALPQSDGFYRDRCRMTDLGTDAAQQNLRYFEMTAAQASSVLEEECRR